MIRVVVVDDHAIVRGGLQQLLATADDIELVGTATNGAEAIVVVGEQEPDVVLMDLSMPLLDGIEATRRITVEHAGTRVVVLTSLSEQAKIMEAIRAGAVGYLLKHAAPDELLAGIRAAHEGGAPLDPKAARVLLDTQRADQPLNQLTSREREVLQSVRDGLANKQIARKLDISEHTVKAHLTHIFQRLGVYDRTQAALWARDNLP